MKESVIEARLRKGVERAGGRCLKFVSPGHTGVPDRIILMPGGRVYFAETKAPGEKERSRQEYVQRKLAELGFKTYASVDSFERVAEVLNDLIEDQKPAKWLSYTGTHYTGKEDDYGDPGYKEHIFYVCSKCRRKTVVREPFCPRCGKRMEGKQE